MRIIIDYDNDCIRFGHDRDLDEGIEKRIITIRGFTTQSIKLIKSLLVELLNMMCDGEEHITICLQEQSEGVITVIEEF